jgi:pimeloyl-ACP methyl ester carboxylesterase
LARSGKQLAGQPLDLSAERFTLYVPPSPPPEGYGVLVFVSPWDDGRLPLGWAAVLDQYGVIYVSASRSGNSADVLTRRVPLAVPAATNVTHQFPVDPHRVYIGGFSGGSRAALRIALGYPDVFRGALLDAGGDPIGNERIPLPSRDLFRKFQSARIVFMTGSEDALHREQANESVQSLRKWCITNVSSDVTPATRHDIMSASALALAFRKLRENLPSSDAVKSAACSAPVESEINQKLEDVANNITKGGRRRARDLLRKLDGQFGGLAAPNLTDPARDCDCGAFD